MAIPGAFLVGAAGFISELFGGDDTEEVTNKLIKESQEAQLKLSKDYDSLITNLDQSLTQFRTESKDKRITARNTLKQELENKTESMLTSFGPLNDDSKARLRTLMNHPIYNQLLEFDLGTTESDLNLGLSGILGSITLEREKQAFMSQAKAARKRNILAAESLKPEPLEDFIQGVNLSAPFLLKK